MFQRSPMIVRPGELNFELAKKLWNESEQRMVFLLRQRNRKYLKAFPKPALIFYDELEKPLNSRALKAASSPIWGSVIDDHQTYLLFDRSRFEAWKGNAIKTLELIQLCLSCQYIIEEIGASTLFLNATPHDLETWCFARVAEELELEVVYLKDTILPWRWSLASGLNRLPPKRETTDTRITTNEQRLFQNYIESKKGSAERALPKYERDRLRRQKNRYYNPKTEIIRFFRRPDLILNKLQCFRRYKALARNPVRDNKVFVLFLHYQPERTTLPEGFGFAQQFAGVKVLRSALPCNVHLLVKEHPSTFTNYCSWKDRRPSFYEAIDALDGVSLAPIEFDAYSLIDRSWGVASVAGTVGFEALVRGRLVVQLGSGPLEDVKHPFLHQYNSEEQLESFLRSSHDARPNIESWDELLIDLGRHSFSGLSDDTVNLEAIESQRVENRSRAYCLALQCAMQSLENNAVGREN